MNMVKTVWLRQELRGRYDQGYRDCEIDEIDEVFCCAGLAAEDYTYLINLNDQG